MISERVAKVLKMREQTKEKAKNDERNTKNTKRKFMLHNIGNGKNA